MTAFAMPQPHLQVDETDGATETVQECASCLAPLTEDDPQPTCDGGDACCLSCEAENEAAEIVLAEVRPHWTPTRTISERRRALWTIEQVIARAKARIDVDESMARASRGGGRCHCGEQMIGPGQTEVAVAGQLHALDGACGYLEHN